VKRDLCVFRANASGVVVEVAVVRVLEKSATGNESLTFVLGVSQALCGDCVGTDEEGARSSHSEVT
jgi:hypothetical protein